MENSAKQMLFWVPRVGGILFILFISLFAFDVFEMGLDLWGTLFALFMHLLPSIVMTIGIIIGWRRGWVGAATFIGWAVWYIFTARELGWEVFAIIAGIPAVIGLLFIVDWVLAKQIPKS